MTKKPEMGGVNPEVTPVENLDEYEREKIETTLKQAEHLTEVIRNYLEMIDYCDGQGIQIRGRTKLDNIRYPNAPAGPDSDLGKLASMFESGQNEIARNLTQEQGDEIYMTRIQPREKK